MILGNYNWCFQDLSGIFPNHILEPICAFASPKPFELFEKTRSRSFGDNSKDILQIDPFPTIGCRVSSIVNQNFKIYSNFFRVFKLVLMAIELWISTFLYLGQRQECSRSTSYKRGKYFLLSTIEIICRTVISQVQTAVSNNDSKLCRLQGTVKHWLRCNYGISYTNDMPSSIKYHLYLSKKGYRSLIYRLDYSYLVNWRAYSGWWIS